MIRAVGNPVNRAVRFPVRSLTSLSPVQESEDLCLDSLSRYLNDLSRSSGSALLGRISSPLRGGDDISVKKFTHGQSNPTYLLHVRAGGDAGGELLKVVLRKKPPGKLLRGAHMVEREGEIMSKLKGSYAVPNFICLEEDDAIIGTPFIMYEYVEGDFYRDFALKGAKSREVRAAVYESVVDKVAALHALDYEGLGLGSFGKGEGYVQRQVNVWIKQIQAVDVDNADLHQVSSWLLSKLSSSKSGSESGRGGFVQHKSIIHGDLRVDNMIFKEDGKISALLDWELSTIGDPGVDVASFCSGYHLRSDTPHLAGVSDLDDSQLQELGLPTELDFVSKYVAATGYSEVAEEIDFYYTFGAFRMACILEGVKGKQC